MPAGASTLGTGDVAEQEWDALYVTFSRLQKEASSKRGHERSAAGGRQGHQFTPAMIDALLREAVSTYKHIFPTASTQSKEFVSRGGFTDVGQHTGGHPRNTAWPLACEVLKVRENICKLPLQNVWQAVKKRCFCPQDIFFWRSNFPQPNDTFQPTVQGHEINMTVTFHQFRAKRAC